MKRVILIGLLLATGGGVHVYDEYSQRAALRATADVVHGAIWLSNRYASRDAQRLMQADGTTFVPIQQAAPTEWAVAVGNCAGCMAIGNRDLLLGDGTQAPNDQPGFVNFGNRLCFWRDSGEVVSCPAPIYTWGAR